MVVYIVMIGILPAMLQRFVVQPNELSKEKQYIERNIKFTRLGYNISNIRFVDWYVPSETFVTDIYLGRGKFFKVRKSKPQRIADEIISKGYRANETIYPIPKM